MPYSPDKLVTKTCEECGGTYSCSPWAAKHRRYCGNKCSANGRWKARGKAPRHEFTCAQCGKQFKRSQSYVRHTARKGFGEPKYCCDRCKYDAMMVGEHRFTCAKCGSEFTRRQPHSGNGKPWTYCSQTCAGKGKRTRYNKTCLTCGKQFETTPKEDAKYCSTLCHKGRVELTCAACGQPFSRKRSYLKRDGTVGLFCSKRCQGLAQRGENSHHWKGGVSDERSLWWGREGKRWIADCLARDAYTCQLCGQYGAVKRNVLEVHHKASWTKYPALRSHPDNGITLCARCHRGRGVGIHSRSMVGQRKRWEADVLPMLASGRGGVS